MPVVTFQRPDLCKLIGRDVPMDELTERMPMMGGDLDEVQGEAITIEWFPDRPDLLTPEGTGRALRAFLGGSTGLPKYKVAKARTELRVDDSVAKVRPYAALCFVRGVPFDADYVDVVVDAQEKLTLAPGRRRKKIAIGIHDADGLEGPFQYTCIGPDDKPFVPLQWDTELTPREVIEKHPKGQEYGHLLPADRYPVFLDGSGQVLSMPPVINAAKTTVTPETRDLLLDVTGTDRQSVRHTIALLASGFAERGGTVEAVTVHDAAGTWTCPDLRATERTIHMDDVNRLLGIDLSGDEAARCLEKMGHGCQSYETQLLVETPAWRFDILHTWDLVEDIAIGYGFENFEGSLPSRVTYGGKLPHQHREDQLRQLMVGHGWYEARTITLSNAAMQWTNWGEEDRSGDAVRLRNPVMEEQTLLRQKLTPSLLGVLAHNRHRNLPQRLFELGYVVVPEPPGGTEREGKGADKGSGQQNGTGVPRNRLRLACVETAAKTGFNEAKGLAEALLRDLDLDASLEPAERPGFIAGRQGRIVMGGSGDADGSEIGHFGELHPDTIVAFGLGAATIALELDVTALGA